ncbi:MAG: hypothetical protein K2N72_04260 [Oscillospiraceae bacterium]|nr:hypothetical protein [Oscillospiraceae bacterium]
MKINREMIRKLRIIVPKTLLILVVLGGFLWFNQKPNFSKYHSYVVETFDGDKIQLTDEQFQRIIEAYGDDIKYMPDWAFEHGTPREGRRIELYKTTDMSGECDIMYTGVIFFEDRDDRALVIGRKKFNGDYSWKAWYYEKQTTIRKVLAVVDEAINEAEGE